MSISAPGISIDAVDAARLANFWAQALSRTVDDGATEDFASIAADADSQRGPLPDVSQRPEGKTLKNRLHFDLQVGDVEVEAERLTRLGAKQIRSLSANNNRWISFIDPERNEFDLVAD
jgi:predicted enzyme related to lactoylglutathione lyase